mgnify:CR=1 FL=1
MHASKPEISHDTLTVLATLAGMLERLERAQKQQRRFVSDASHELRSPITVIRHHAEVALAHPATADFGRWFAARVLPVARTQDWYRDT